MAWYVKTESRESEQHIALVVYHGPMSKFAAQLFPLGIDYVDDPTISSVLVDTIPEGARTKELFQDENR